MNTFTQTQVDEVTSTIVKNPHSVEKWLNLADKYMQTLAEDKTGFLLPKAHEFLKPLIYTYYTNVEGFSFYLIEVRDRFSKEDLTWDQVQKLYRRINGRYVQQVRRERASRACAKAEDIFGSTDYHSRLQWVADLEHLWAGRRLLFLDSHREASKTERIDTETRAELLAEFWDIIDTEIFEGKGLPPWN